MPDIEQRFWNKYRDAGLQVVAIDPDDYDAQSPDAVQAYADGVGVSFPVGIELTETYDELIVTYDHRHPYPLDVIVDRNGKIAYIAREYDAVAMEEVIGRLLSE